MVQHEMMVLVVIIIITSSHALSTYSVPHAVPFTSS